jgi:hypothetical protein
MQEAMRYALMSLALGLVGYWASEALFWSFPPDEVTVVQWMMTVAAYALAGACALSAVIWARTGGWRAAFLGGAALGFVIEGVIVSTMYDAFPFQLVWTPLAWHGVVTGMAVFGLHQVLVGGAVGRQALAMVVLGLGGGVFAAYWPQERAVLPSVGSILLYHLGTGAAAVAGFVLWARIGRLPHPSSVVLLLVPVLAVLLWILQGVADPRPQRLALLPMLGLTLWAMRRLGRAGPCPPVTPPLWRHGLFLIAPLTTALIAAFVVRGTPGFASNIVAALTFGPLGLGLWVWLLWQAFRRPFAEQPPLK